MCPRPSMHQCSWAELQLPEAQCASCMVFFIRIRKLPKKLNLLLQSELWTRATTVWKKPAVWPCCQDDCARLEPIIRVSTLAVASAKIAVRAWHSEREGDASFMELIHCFVVKVIEVTILRDLCRMPHRSFRSTVEKINVWRRLCPYLAHSIAAAILQPAKASYIHLHRSTEGKAILIHLE